MRDNPDAPASARLLAVTPNDQQGTSASAGDLAFGRAQTPWLEAWLEDSEARRWRAETLLRLIIDRPPADLDPRHVLHELSWSLLGERDEAFWLNPCAEFGGITPSTAVGLGQYSPVARLLAVEHLNNDAEQADRPGDRAVSAILADEHSAFQNASPSATGDNG